MAIVTLLLTSSSQQWQILPSVNTSRGQSDLFTVQCCHWDSKADITPIIQHYQRTEWSPHCSMMSLTLKGRYTPPIQHYQRTEWSLYCTMLSLTLKGRYNPLWSTLSEDRVITSLFNVVIDTKRQIYLPPVNSMQRIEWSLYCSKLSLRLKGRYTSPHSSTIAEDRVISSLLNVVIDTQRQIYPSRSTLLEDRVISLLFNVVIETQEADIPTPPMVNTIRGQSDLFTFECCHWDSKADIPPLVNTSRGQSDLLHCSMLSLRLKGRYTSPSRY